MSPEAKGKLLAAFDALTAIEYGRNPGPRRSAKGGSMQCDHCGRAHASPAAALDCPIGIAAHALSKVVPPYTERAAWLAKADE